MFSINCWWRSKDTAGTCRPPSVISPATCCCGRTARVELVDRAEAAGLVERTPDGDDGRVVRVRLTSEGDRVLQKLTRAHLDRLHELATVLDDLVSRPGADSRG